MKTLPSTFHIPVNSPEHSKAVQTRLFEFGFEWNTFKQTPSYLNEKVLVARGKELSFGNQEGYSYTENLLTLNDLYEMKVKKESVEVATGNASYPKAVVYKDKIVVGCQTFPIELGQKLVNALKELD